MDLVSIPCPACGYDLRGVPATGEFYRCPECGGLTTLERLDHLRRRQQMWRIVILSGGVLLVAALLWLTFLS